MALQLAGNGLHHVRRQILVVEGNRLHRQPLPILRSQQLDQQLRLGAKLLTQAMLGQLGFSTVEPVVEPVLDPALRLAGLAAFPLAQLMTVMQVDQAMAVNVGPPGLGDIPVLGQPFDLRAVVLAGQRVIGKEQTVAPWGHAEHRLPAWPTVAHAPQRQTRATRPESDSSYPH